MSVRRISLLSSALLIPAVVAVTVGLHGPADKVMFLAGTALLVAAVAAEAHTAITEHAEVSRQMDRHAHHDTLTGLPGQVFTATYCLATLLPAAARPGAVLFIDLDGFKEVNDTWGHQAGDEFLVLCPTLSNSAAAPETADRVVIALEAPSAWPPAKRTCRRRWGW